MTREKSLDGIERVIIKRLLKDARTPLSDIAKQLRVSPATIHGRFEGLKERGIITGSRVIVDKSKLGYAVGAFIGISVAARSTSEIANVLEKNPNVVEIHYPTGRYSLLIKTYSVDIREFHEFLLLLQQVEGVVSTEAFMLVDSPIEREVNIAQVA